LEVIRCFAAVDIGHSSKIESRKAERRHTLVRARCRLSPQCIVGMVKLAPSLMPDGQRAVTVLVRV
jgi:hypothetical protein